MRCGALRGTGAWAGAGGAVVPPAHPGAFAAELPRQHERRAKVRKKGPSLAGAEQSAVPGGLAFRRHGRGGHRSRRRASVSPVQPTRATLGPLLAGEPGKLL